MSATPRVSVIMPFYNAEAHIAEAIASVLSQTEGDWELILVDDASTDGGRAIAERVANEDRRVILLDRSRSENRGPGATRNEALRQARGEFVAFLDADDAFEPEMLEHYLSAAQQNPGCAMVFGPTRWWYPDGHDWVEPIGGLAGRVHAPPVLVRDVILMQYGHVPCICSVLVSRTAIMAVGGFEERLRLYEDQCLWAKLFLDYRVYVTAKCLSRYRQHPQSTSSSATEQGDYSLMNEHPAREVFLRWLSDYMARSGPTDAMLEKAMRLAKAPYVANPTWRTRLDRIALPTLRRTVRFQHRLMGFFGS